MDFPFGLILELWKRAGFEVKKSGSSWISSTCPRCGKAKTGHRVSIDPEANVWKCFGENCGAAGGIKDFCEEMGWDFKEVLEEFEVIESSEKKKEAFHDLRLILGKLSEEAISYLRDRRIDLQAVDKYVFGINPFSHSYAKWLWDHGYRFFIPQYSSDGRILSGRFRLVKEGEAKSRSPKGRSNFLFREIVLEDMIKDSVGVIVEGEIDFLSALTISRSSLDFPEGYIFYAVPGAKYTFREEEIKSIPAEVVLFLDRGAEEDAERLARQLYAYGKKVFLGRYPDPYKDLNEWLLAEGKENTGIGFLKAIERAWVDGVYTPLKGISQKVEEFVSELIRTVEERDKISKTEYRMLQKVYPTGIKELDEILSGGFRPALYGIAGAPGSGKTSFLLALLKRIIKENNAYILFASLEMPLTHIIAYLLSWKARMSWLRILNADIVSSELEKIKRAKDELNWLFRSLHILHGPLSVRDIEKELVELKNAALDEKRPFFVAVDYLQMLRFNKSVELRLGVTEAVRELAEISNKHEVPVIVISTTARQAVEQALKGSKSLKEVFKESGDIEYALFAGFLLVKEEERTPGERKNRLIVAKNRGGAELKGGSPIEYTFTFNVFTGEMQ